MYFVCFAVVAVSSSYSIRAWRMIWAVWNEPYTVYLQTGRPGAVSPPRSTVTVACCLTVNEAGKWQWLGVGTSFIRSLLSCPISSILYSRLWCPYVWHTLMAISQIKTTFYNNSRFGCQHIILPSPRNVKIEPRTWNGLFLFKNLQ